jgi:hypothetical protein
MDCTSKIPMQQIAARDGGAWSEQDHKLEQEWRKRGG